MAALCELRLGTTARVEAKSLCKYSGGVTRINLSKLRCQSSCRKAAMDVRLSAYSCEDGVAQIRGASRTLEALQKLQYLEWNVLAGGTVGVSAVVGA